MKPVKKKYVSMKPNTRYIEPALHLLVLAYIFISPFYFSHNDEPVPWQKYVQFIIVPTSLCLCFYINYLVLVPRCFMTRRYKSYYIYNTIIIILLVMGITAFMHYVTPMLHESMARDGIESFKHGAFQGGKPFHSPKHFHDGKPGRWPKGILGGPMAIRDAISLVFVAGGAMAMRLSVEWRRNEQMLHKIHLQQTDAALKNLKTQTSPHFLLNTLNNIYSLTAFDTEKAQHAISELSKMLRYQLYESDAEKVLLRKEANFLNNYIELMRLRLSDNVKVETNIHIAPDESIVIAPHILISLVENAFKHGVSSQAPSFISINLDADLERIHFTCSNSCHPQSKSSDKTQGGIGLHQVEQRLHLIYSGFYKWSYGTSEDGKTYNSELIIYNDAPPKN